MKSVRSLQEKLHTQHVPPTCKAWWTLARIDGNGVMTDATISTRVALTVIDVNLAAVTGETNRARTAKCVDQIVAYTSIQTRIQLALVDVDLTLCAREACNRPSFCRTC
jgi:hypothetical protein